MADVAPARVRRDAAARMSAAAIALLDGLDAPQRAIAAWPFPSDGERTLWYYTPTDHGGLTLSAMTPRQQQLTMRLLRSGLSRAGYVTAATIIGLDNVLDEAEGWRMEWGRERGRDPGLYYVRVFGDPSAASWSWRFGGHHVSVHMTVVDGEVRAPTPCFLGADPAAAPLLGPHMLRPLAAVEDLARDLVRGLDDAQRATATLSPIAPTDLVTANRSELADGDVALALAEVWRGRFEGRFAALADDAQRRMDAATGATATSAHDVRYTASPRGLPAARMTDPQRELLRAVLDTYVGRIADDLAELEARKYAGTAIDALHFAWAGGVEPGQPHYYRIQGPRLLAEYDNTARDANHVHSVWRDPDGDFGRDALTAHRATHRHD